MLVLSADGLQQRGAQSAVDGKAVQQGDEEAHMGQLHAVAFADGGERFLREAHHFIQRDDAQRADAFQTQLADFPVAAARAVHPVDIFKIVEFFGGFICGVGIFGDGEGDVRLQCADAAVDIMEGNDIRAFEEVFVFKVEIIFFESAHAVFAVAIPLIQTAQIEGDLLLAAQNTGHVLSHFHVLPGVF